MKRTPLKRRTPLRASNSLKRSRMKPYRRKPRPGLDSAAYLRWIRSLPCCGPGCNAPAPSHAHHMTGAGLALKSDDRNTMPLCSKCHAELHEFRGAWRGTRTARFAWQCEQVARHQALYAGRAA